MSVLWKKHAAFRKQLGLGLQEQAAKVYQQLWDIEDHKMSGQAYGRRKLRNRCLWLLMKSNESANLDLCRRQFAVAETMTDQLASFSLLVNSSDEKERTKAIQSFYKQWSKEELVIDKWFSVQAMSELPHTLESVKELLKHPLFSIKNPNKVRAVTGAFCLSNPGNFHNLDDSGYNFLKEQLLILDKINPQVAARLATPFTRWQRFDKPRQDLMQSHLKELAKSKLSRDLQEVVSKSLV